MSKKTIQDLKAVGESGFAAPKLFERASEKREATVTIEGARARKTGGCFASLLESHQDPESFSHRRITIMIKRGRAAQDWSGF